MGRKKEMTSELWESKGGKIICCIRDEEED